MKLWRTCGVFLRRQRRLGTVASVYRKVLLRKANCMQQGRIRASAGAGGWGLFTAFQAVGRGFESRLPLHTAIRKSTTTYYKKKAYREGRWAIVFAHLRH